MIGPFIPLQVPSNEKMENHHPQQIHPWVSKPKPDPNDKSRPFLDSTSPSTYLVDPSTKVSTLRPVIRSHGDPHSFDSGSSTNSRASLNLAQTYFKAREDQVLEKHDSISKFKSQILLSRKRMTKKNPVFSWNQNYLVIHCGMRDKNELNVFVHRILKPDFSMYLVFNVELNGTIIILGFHQAIIDLLWPSWAQ